MQWGYIDHIDSSWANSSHVEVALTRPYKVDGIAFAQSLTPYPHPTTARLSADKSKIIVDTDSLNQRSRGTTFTYMTIGY